MTENLENEILSYWGQIDPKTPHVFKFEKFSPTFHKTLKVKLIFESFIFQSKAYFAIHIQLSKGLTSVQQELVLGEYDEVNNFLHSHHLRETLQKRLLTLEKKY